MKTLNELYIEVNADESLKAEYVEAAENGKIEEFLKAHDCEATISEFDEFMKNADGKSGELSDDELDNVAAGKKCGTVYKNGRPVVAVTNGYECDYFRCKTCGKTRAEVCQDSSKGPVLSPNCHRSGPRCGRCKHCKYIGGLWLCYCEERVNN